MTPAKAAIPGTTPPGGLPTFSRDGSILPPARKDHGSARHRPPPADPLDRRPARAARARLDWVLMLAVAGAASRSARCSSGRPPSHRDDLTGGDPTAYLKKQLVNVAIGLVLMVLVMATDHRWVRILAPLVYLASVVGLVLVLAMGATINGSRSWLMLGGMSIQPSEFAKLAVVIGMALLVAERAEGRWRSAGRHRRGGRHAA